MLTAQLRPDRASGWASRRTGDRSREAPGPVHSTSAVSAPEREQSPAEPDAEGDQHQHSGAGEGGRPRPAAGTSRAARRAGTRARSAASAPRRTTWCRAARAGRRRAPRSATCRGAAPRARASAIAVRYGATTAATPTPAVAVRPSSTRRNRSAADARGGWSSQAAGIQSAPYGSGCRSDCWSGCGPVRRRRGLVGLPVRRRVVVRRGVLVVAAGRRLLLAAGHRLLERAGRGLVDPLGGPQQ